VRVNLHGTGRPDMERLMEEEKDDVDTRKQNKLTWKRIWKKRGTLRKGQENELRLMEMAAVEEIYYFIYVWTRVITKFRYTLFQRHFVEVQRNFVNVTKFAKYYFYFAKISCRDISYPP
jgi:hypothetical protein